jgi:V/A-type H+-transporting ATPase subunit C
MSYLHAHAVSSHDQRYAYAAGRVRALEMRLLGRQRLERMAEAKDLDEAVRLLSDTEYAVHFEELEELGYDTCLRSEERRVLDLVDALSRDRGVSDILRLRFDFHNLKVALREHLSGRDLGHLLVDLGRYDAEAMRAALRTETTGKLPGPLAEAAAMAMGAYSTSQDPADADREVDAVMFGHFLASARDYVSPYLELLVRTWIDLANIRVFMRARYLQIESRALPAMLVGGGQVKPEDLSACFTLPLDEVLQRFEFSPYRRIMETGGEGLEREGSFVHLEREIDNHMISFLRLARYFTFGLEVLFAYALLRFNEIKTLRLILAGRERGVAQEIIKERIPDAD